MKTHNWKLATALGAAALLGIAALQAQELHQARVPFTFEVAGHKMEAGTYRAVLDNQGSLMVENTGTNHRVYLLPLPRTPADNGKSNMTFRCYSGQCFLSTLQFGQTERIYGVPKTRHEREVAGMETSKTVLVAMR